jgi:hypothetical protein
LAKCLYYQRTWDVELEQLLQRLSQQLENLLGAEDKATLEVKLILAKTLFNRKKYDKAEKLLEQFHVQQVKVLGVEHEDTIEGEYILAKTYLELK